MTDELKDKILEMKYGGAKAIRIAKELNMSYNTVKSFIRRHKDDNSELAKMIIGESHDETKCLCCETELEFVAGKKKKKFCSNNCRLKYWRKHHDK